MEKRFRNENLPEENVKKDKFRIKFFTERSLELLPEMRLLLRGGKLSKSEGWRNVVEHCFVQAIAAETIGCLIGLLNNDIYKLIKVAACHDWKKRLEKKPQEFSDEERQKAQMFLDKVNPDTNLMEATGTRFLEKALVKKESTFLERLQFYLDDITKGSEIVPFNERIDEVESRRQDLNNDADLTACLGGRYWDKERELGHLVEEEIFNLLKKDVVINSPADIPNLILEEINKQIEKNVRV